MPDILVDSNVLLDVLTDDPTQPGPTDPTVIPVSAAPSRRPVRHGMEGMIQRPKPPVPRSINRASSHRRSREGRACSKAPRPVPPRVRSKRARAGYWSCCISCQIAQRTQPIAPMQIVELTASAVSGSIVARPQRRSRAARIAQAHFHSNQFPRFTRGMVRRIRRDRCSRNVTLSRL